MPEGSSFSLKDFAEVIVKMLGLKPGDTVQVLRDRADPERLMIVRHGQEKAGGS